MFSLVVQHMSILLQIVTRLLTIVFGLALIAGGVMRYSKKGGLLILVARLILGIPLILSVLSSRGYKSAMFLSVAAFTYFGMRYIQHHQYFVEGFDFTYHYSLAPAAAAVVLALMNYALLPKVKKD